LVTIQINDGFNDTNILLTPGHAQTKNQVLPPAKFLSSC